MKISKVIASILSTLLFFNALTLNFPMFNEQIFSVSAETDEDEYSVGEYSIGNNYGSKLLYKKFSDHVEIYGCTNSSHVYVLTVPEKIEDLPVTAIYNCSFDYLQSFSVSDNLNCISNCYLGNWYKSWYNSQPDGLIYIGKVLYGFKGSIYDLYDLNIKDGTKGICYPFVDYYFTSVSLPDSIEYICDNAFESCMHLKNIKLPDNLIKIGDSTFAGCSDLKEIALPDGLKAIGDLAFVNCSSLESVYMSDNVTEIGAGAFGGCRNLESVRLSDNITKFETFSAMGGLFKYCENLKEINFPKNLKSIGAYTFEGCKSLTSITLPDGLERIAAFAFYDCKSLEMVSTDSKKANVGECILPANLKFHGDHAFYQDMLDTLIVQSKIDGLRHLIFIGFSTVKFYNPDCEIAEKLFDDSDVYTYNPKYPLTIYGFDGSVAQQYAMEKGIPFVLLESTEVKGDCNCDNVVNIADAVMLQKYLLGNGTLTNWKNADLCEDEIIDVFDIVLMRRLLIEKIE